MGRADQRTLANILRWKALLAAAGVILWWLLVDSRHALGFAAGALASAASFYLLRQASNIAAGDKVSASKIGLAALRILIIGTLLFVIIRDYGLPPKAIATGLLVTVVSITIEVIREHFHA